MFNVSYCLFAVVVSCFSVPILSAANSTQQPLISLPRIMEDGTAQTVIGSVYGVRSLERGLYLDQAVRSQSMSRQFRIFGLDRYVVRCEDSYQAVRYLGSASGDIEVDVPLLHVGSQGGNWSSVRSLAPGGSFWSRNSRQTDYELNEFKTGARSQGNLSPVDFFRCIMKSRVRFSYGETGLRHTKTPLKLQWK